MDSEILVNEQIEAGAEFLQKLAEHYPINAAFWVQSNETETLYLYIASEAITSRNFTSAYGDIVKIARELGNPNFDPSRVKIIWTDDRMAQAAIRLYERNHQKIPARFRGTVFGGMTVDEVYIYPPTNVVATK